MGPGDEGEQASLPVEDELLALRQALWLATDRDYKRAVETLTRKRAYLKDKSVLDRPPTSRPRRRSSWPARPPASSSTSPPGGATATDVRGLRRFAVVQDSEVRFIAGAQNLYIVNSEGTRLRMPDTAALIALRAEVQAADGMRLSDARLYVGKTPDDLPAPEVIERDLEAMVRELEAGRDAEVLDRYSGPVLFDGVAGAQVFRALLGNAWPAGRRGRRTAVPPGRPQPRGQARHALVAGIVQAWMTRPWTGGTEAPCSHYRYDDEAVRRSASSSSATDDWSTSAWRARRPANSALERTWAKHGRPGARASVANLFIEDQKGCPRPN